MSEEKHSFTITIGGWTTHALGIAFVVLKLCHKIDWSWWWVTSPFWIPWAIVGVIFLLILFAAASLPRQKRYF